MKDIELETIKLRLDGVKLAIGRCRFAFVVTMIASIAIIATVWNAHMSSDSWFARQAYWSQDKQFTAEMQKQRSDSVTAARKAPLPPEKITDVTDQVQREILSEWVKNQVISVGLLGIRVSVEDFSILGSMGLLVTTLFMFYSIRNENIGMGNLLKHAFKFSDWDDRYLVYQGIVPHLIFLDLGDLHKPIDDFEKPSDIKKMPLVPPKIKVLLWLPALTIFVIVAADIWTLYFAPNPFRPSGLPLRSILDNHDLNIRLAYDAIALLLGVWAGVMCGEIVRYATASGRLIKKFRTHLLDTCGHIGGGPRKLSNEPAPKTVEPALKTVDPVPVTG
jgi:hypothetical protein